MDKKEPTPLVEAGIEQQACLGLCRFHEAVSEVLTFDIETEHESVPEPGTILGLLTLAGLGLGSRFNGNVG